MADILIYAEQIGGKFRRAALEAVNKGKEIAGALGGQAVALVVGEGIGDIAGTLGAYGADKVLTVENPALKNFSVSGHGKAVAETAKKIGAGVVMCAATATGKDLGPAVAALLDAGIASDCTGIEVADGKIRADTGHRAGVAVATVDLDEGYEYWAARPDLRTLKDVFLGLRRPETYGMLTQPQPENPPWRIAEPKLSPAVREMIAEREKGQNEGDDG